jgi:hypothetical protein
MTDRLVSTPAVVRFGNIEVDIRAGAMRRNGASASRFPISRCIS